MAREKPGFRDNLELLNIRYPDHDMRSMQEVMQGTGFSINTVKKHLGELFVNKRFSKAALARYMCG